MSQETTSSISVTFGAKTIATVFAIGIIAGSGARTAEWLIPPSPIAVEIKKVCQ